MKKRKPFYQPGDLVQIRDVGCNTSWKMLNKTALVLKVYSEGHDDFIRYYGDKPIYDVQVFDVTPDDGFNHPSGHGPSKFIEGRHDRLRIRQCDLRKFKKFIKCKDCGQKFKNQTTWACYCKKCYDALGIDYI